MKMEPKLHPQTCPCCDQTVKLYRRTITDAMLAALKVLNYIGPSSARRWQEFIIQYGFGRESGGGDKVKLTYWGLVGKSELGQYYVTHKGRSFLNGEVEVPKYAFVYNGKVVGLSEDLMDVSEAKHFDFADL